MPEFALDQVLQSVGLPPGSSPPRPVLHAPTGTLLSFGILPEEGPLQWTGVWVTPTSVTFIDPDPPKCHMSQTLGLTGPAAGLLDRLTLAAHAALARIEELDQELLEIEARPRIAPRVLWPPRQRTALIRSQLDRALVTASQCAGPLSARFPGFDAAFSTLEAELLRLQKLAEGIQSAISDLIVARNVEESNRIAEAANRLAATSNRIAALANSSNVRMLGITYLALVLALVSAVILFPNTGATILGMPSAAWVPGIWVNVALVALAVVPLVWVLTRPWVRRILADLRGYEGVAAEGVRGLPEVTAEGVPEPGTPGS